MWTLLLRISLPELRKHLLRSMLTLLGIALGVSVFVATRSANSSLRASLRETIDRIAGKASLEVSAGESGMPESVLEDVRGVEGVAAAAPVVEAVVRTADAAQGNILILGVDMAGDRSLREYELEDKEEVVSDPLVFLAQPDSLIVAREFAGRNGLHEGSAVDLITAVGKKRFTLRGIMTPKGMALAFGGNLGVMDIYSAQFVFGRGQRFDRIDVAIREGQKTEEVRARIRRKIGPGYQVEPPARRGTQTESLFAAYNGALFISSVIAMALGLFLIFNVFSISLTERRVQIGILRALGVTRAQIQRLFLGESFVLGLLGSSAGAVLGHLMGRGVMASMLQVVEQGYGVRVWAGGIRFDPFWSAASILAGLAASMAGAWLPARAAARVDPALALQKGKYQVLYLGENRARRRFGFALLAICLMLGFTPWASSLPVQVCLFALISLGISLLVPTFSHLLARLLRRPMGAFFGMEGRLAGDSLVQAPRRTSATVSALMFSIAFVLVIATFGSSVKASLLRWIEASINPDLFVYPSDSLTVRSIQFPPSLGEELRKIPGVRQVDSVRILVIDYGNRRPLLVSIELEPYLRRSTPLMEEGSVEDLGPGMSGRNGALISNNFAHMHRLGRGHRMYLDSPTGRHEFMVVGVSADYSSDSGSILIDREVYVRLWQDDRVDTFDIMLEKGSDPERVRGEIQKRIAGSRNVFILTNRDMRSEILRLTDQFLSLQYVQLLVAVLVATLGILNSLMVSITERKREIGILRSLGGERPCVRRAVLLEAVCVGLVSAVLGIAGGTILGSYSVRTFGAAFNGWVFPFVFPWEIACALVPGVLIVSLLAAWYPSSRALKTPIVEALAYE